LSISNRGIRRIMAKFVCRSCGVIQESEEDWTGARMIALGMGWQFLQTKVGWFHFCPDCPLQVGPRAITNPVKPKKKKKKYTKSEAETFRTDKEVGVDWDRVFKKDK
jgi:hypothetical protein